MPEIAYYAALVFGVCLLTAHLIVRFVWPYLDKSSKLTRQLASNIAMKKNPLGAAFVNEFLTTKFNHWSKSGNFSTERFEELLRAEFPQMEKISESCSINMGQENPSWCTAIVKLSKDLPALIQYNFETWHTEDGQGRPILRFKKEGEISNYVGVDKRTPVSMSVEVSFEGEAGEFARDRVMELVELASVEHIHYEAPERRIRLYRIQPGMHGYQPVPYDVRVARQTSEYLNTAYEPVSIEYGDGKESLPMASALKVMAATLKAGDNIQIYGKTGTGKSRLLEQLCSEIIVDYSNTICIMLTPSILTELQSANAQATLIMNIKQLQVAQNARIIFIIDEAEPLLEESKSGIHTSNQSFLLQLMSGTLQTELGCSTVLAYNADPAKLNSKMYRRGRTGMLIELQQLTAPRARKLVEYLRTHLIERSFDEKFFEKVLAERNMLPNNEEYAKQGEISIADVYAAFIDRDKRALIIDLIRAERGLPSIKKEKVVSKKEVVPVALELDAIDEEPSKPAAASEAPIASIKKHRNRKRNRSKSK